MYKKLLLLIVCSLYLFWAAMALTPKENKWVKTLKSITIEYLSPKWFTPLNLDQAPEDIEYWKNIIPNSEDRNGDMYIVMPTLWLISPVISIPQNSQDYKNMVSGKEIDINKYLVDWVMFYPKTWKIGEAGNPVIFGHSNFYKTGKWKYKTIFADIMNLDVWYKDEIWVFVKNTQDKSYDLYKYAITESYETNPENVSILKPKGWKEITVFACTDGLNGRWILRGKLIEKWEMLVRASMRERMNTIIAKLSKKSPSSKKEIITLIVEKIQAMKKSLPEKKNYAMKYRLYLLDYIEKRLIDLY